MTDLREEFEFLEKARPGKWKTELEHFARHMLHPSTGSGLMKAQLLIG